MSTPEYERIFQLSNRRGADEEEIPETAQRDNERNLTAAQVIAEIEKNDASRLRRHQNLISRGTAATGQHVLPPAASEPLDWRMHLDKEGRFGFTVTIAQQCVYVGNKNYLSRRQRTIDVLTHLLDTDPDLAWGRIRFASGKDPDATIMLACTKARPDLVELMCNHPTADYYLPSDAPPEERPVPGVSLVKLMKETIEYNTGLAVTREKDDAQRCAARHECAMVLKRLHQRRHGHEQRMLERVMQDRLN